MTLEVAFWPPHQCTHTYTYPHIRMHAQTHIPHKDVMGTEWTQVTVEPQEGAVSFKLRPKRDRQSSERGGKQSLG